MRTRRLCAGLAVAAAALGIAGCGDDEEAATTTSGTAGKETAGTATGTGTRSEPATAERQPSTSGSREDETPGGPGDEIPASGPADFTGRDGRIGPRVVRVPPYLGIGVTLRSADGGKYALRVGGKTLRVDGARRTATARLEGLRPGRSYSGAATTGNKGSVRIEASAEPGP